jgi:NADPH-dependent curcumin reductase CurA
VTNHQIRLAARPSGIPKPSDWQLTEAPVPEPAPGELVVENAYLSIDPIMRRWAAADGPVGIGDVMEASVVGRVSASEHPGFAIGEHVYGGFGVQEFARSDGSGVTKLDPLLAPLTAYLAALGIPGLTAYFGLDVGRPQAGDTIVVSGAAGGVGSVSGQLAKTRGFRVIGIAGGPAKRRWLVDELGFDAAIDYRAQDVGDRLDELAPDGVNVFVDNVGGGVLDAVLLHLARGARVVISGGLSQYNADRPSGPSNYLQLLWRRASMTGFLTPDYEDRYPEARAELAALLHDGRLVSREQLVEGGVPAFPELLPMVFSGASTGKLILAL